MFLSSYIRYRMYIIKSNVRLACICQKTQTPLSNVDEGLVERLTLAMLFVYLN